jgi:thiamine-phosphate pyrophosphorylase
VTRFLRSPPGGSLRAASSGLPAVLAITPGDRPLVPWIEALADAGLQGLLVREPALDRAGLSAVLDAARRIAFVSVHTRNPHAIELAGDRGLHVHVSSGRAPVDGVPTGVSCHSAEQVEAAFRGGGTYVLLSPVWTPTSKPTDRRPPLGLDRFLVVAGTRPVYALGGVDAARHHTLRARGAWGSAILGGIFAAASPAEAAARLRFLLDAGQPPSVS